ncbi:MAG TPA: hypothetical protein VNV41_18675 [Candidatus Acidoferrales bacterium]|jgi:hypothetical protein|nr:hypothetical protein [Candidatus Acidoferrales bacterium]
MRLPESWTERLPFLEPLENDWEPVHRLALGIACAFYVLYLYQAARGTGVLLMIDLVFIPIHEGGHLLFRFFGEFLAVAGGTILQLAVPLMLATFFIFQRQILGTTFCVFFFFEQFLPVATYMADARAQELPLLTVGDGDYVIHDWAYLFGKFDVLDHDTQIAHFVRVVGWLGMIATVAWMIWRSVQPKAGPVKASL